jgi:PAS domain S-box-containing protein
MTRAFNGRYNLLAAHIASVTWPRSPCYLPKRKTAMPYGTRSWPRLARKRTDMGWCACESQTRRRLENTPGFAVILGSTGEIEDASEQFLRFLGKTLAEVCECTLPGLNHPNDSLETSDLVERAVASGDTYDVDLRLRGSAGQYRWFHASGIPLRATRERIDLWYVLLIDIDDRKRINVDLSERERQFRRSEAVIAEGERRR